MKRKYFELPADNGNPPWYPPNFGDFEPRDPLDPVAYGA